MRPSDIRRALLRWAETHDRPLPWRGERDPYRVLVSEVMLQQTQASRVVDAYSRFLKRFPTVESLAHASSADVLRGWGNLGYNRRALNLHRAARAVVERRGFPETIGELEELPGVGAYTARAVASFAFHADTEVVEANVRRILSRLAPSADVSVLARKLVPAGRSAAWNQALFDLGADVCRPRGPRCGDCPLERFCATRGAGESKRRPTPRFESTTRYARGRVVDALRGGPASLRRLRGTTGLPTRRLREAVVSLQRDGLVTSSGRVIELGSGESRRR